MRTQRAVKFCLLLLAATIACVYQRAGTAQSRTDLSGYELPFGNNPFAPSNANTTTGSFISQDEFIPAARCAGCHQTAHEQWNESPHRNSFREPFYQANVKHLIRERSLAATRHCESCHNPVALFSGALSAQAAQAKTQRPFDEEGVSCSVCHSINATTTTGIGSYVMAPPALLEKADGTRLREATDQQVLADLPAHKRAVMRPLLKTSEFCAACHKAAVVPELNQRKWLRSFAVYDEWQQSAFSNETVQPLNRRERQSCQDCHMPREAFTPPSGREKALWQSLGANATPRTLSSHRWPGANTAIPDHYDWPAQQQAVKKLLQNAGITVDIFALHRNCNEAANHQAVTDASFTAPFDRTAVTVQPGEQIAVDVVVANRGTGHSFPAELRDIFEAWLEFRATDAQGRTVFHSGAVRVDGQLDWEAHAYRAVQIGEQNNLIWQHDIWNTRIAALDRHIPAGRADLARFAFTVPANIHGPLRLTATLNYRRFNQRFIEWVRQDSKVKSAPVTEMAQTTATLSVTPANAERASIAPSSPSDSPTGNAAGLFVRWRAYAVALFDQQQYEAALQAAQQARALVAATAPEAAAINIDIALICLRLERTGASQMILAQAEQSLALALQLDPASARAQYLLALLRIKQFRYGEAQALLEKLAREFPRDRQVRLQLAGLYFLQRQDGEARSVYEQVLAIDPDDTEAHLKLTGLYWRFGETDRARRSQDAYQFRHLDTVAETLRRNYLRAHPELFATWPWREFGDNPIGSQ